MLALDASLFYLRDFEQFPSHWIESVKCLLEMCWSRWKREDARINASMEKSLYHHRTKRHKIDDQSETDDDIKEMLPVYDNLDEYSEHTGHDGLVEKTSTQFTNEEMKRIAMVFSLVFGVPSVKFEVEMPLTGAYVYAAPLLKAHGWLSGAFSVFIMFPDLLHLFLCVHDIWWYLINILTVLFLYHRAVY